MFTSTNLKNTLVAITRRQDLALVLLLVLAIFMMILPLPTVLVDVLIASNLAMTICILMVGIYLRDPLNFSTLPSVILLMTVFRLAISITTTRLILAQADAGRIVETFGTFVVAGNLIVGLVVFMIITIVQFVVITKGAERIAEVSARFSLDALPGKQMSIDSDLRSNVIDVTEARRRREHLQKESQFYGSMDGAMKFVKGDAIAGLVIIAVNLIGGIAVGTLQQDMSAGDALQIYALLTVGDGLISQIPALFVSITSGIIVTRVIDENSENLGVDISLQMIAEPRVFRLAGIVMILFAFVPGFPTPIFLFLGAVIGGIGLIFYLRDYRENKQQAKHQEHMLSLGDAETFERGLALPAPAIAVTMQIGRKLRDTVDPIEFKSQLDQMRLLIYEDLGVVLPKVNLEYNHRLEESAWTVIMESVPVGDGHLDSDLLWIRDERDHLEIADIPFQEERGFLPGRQVYMVEERWRNRLEDTGIAFMSQTSTCVWLLVRSLMRYVDEFVGVHETRTLMASLEPHHGELVREVQRVLPLRSIADILRRLVVEGVPIRNMRPVLSALLEWGQREQDVALLTEYVRGALKRQICFRYVNPQKMMPVLLVDTEVEGVIRQAIRHTSAGSYLTLDQTIMDQIVSRIRDELAGLSERRQSPVIVTAFDVRRFVRSLLETNGLDLPVLSHQELASEISVQPVSTIAI